MRDGLAAAGGAALAGGAAALLAPGTALAAPAQVQARAITHALEIEQLLVIAYRQVLASDVAGPAVKGQLHPLLGQEIEHVRLLQRALMSRGEIIPAPPSLSAAQAMLARHQVHWSLTHLRSQHDCLKLLVDVESLAENAYFRAIEKLEDLTLVRTCAEIMGAEAQHWTIMSGLLNHQRAIKDVPYPFVEGTP